MARASRIPANSACDRRASLAASRADRESPRAIEDDARLRELLNFGQALAAWAAQFDPRSPATLLAAGATGPHGIDALLAFIDDTLLRSAPYAARHAGGRPLAAGDHEAEGARASVRTSGNENATATAWAERRQQLFRTLNTFRFLREHVAGNLRTEPELSYPYDESPDDVPWSWTWEPADDETTVVAQSWFSQFLKHGILQRGVADAQRIHDRVARHGRLELFHLVERMQSDECEEGFPRMRARLGMMQTGKKKARAKAALRKFERLTLALKDLIPEPASGDPQPFGRPHQEFLAVPLTDQVVAAGRDYIAACLPLLGQAKGSLQARRKKVSRWLSVVTQYVFLASSNGRFRRFAELVAAVDVFARYLQEDVAELLDATSAGERPGGDELQAMVHRMNLMVVEPQVLSRWAAACERAGGRGGAPFYGKCISAIVDSEGRQAKPWGRGDVLPALSRAGLVTAKAQRKKIDAVTDVCVVMQQVGLAIQVPFDHLLAEGSPPPTRKRKGHMVFPHDGLPWIVNPLGTALIQPVATHTDTVPRGRAKRRPKAMTVDGAPVPRGTESETTKQRRGAEPKPVKRQATRERSLPKAAKKWPRA